MDWPKAKTDEVETYPALPPTVTHPKSPHAPLKSRWSILFWRQKSIQKTAADSGAADPRLKGAVDAPCKRYQEARSPAGLPAKQRRASGALRQTAPRSYRRPRRLYLLAPTWALPRPGPGSQTAGPPAPERQRQSNLPTAGSSDFAVLVPRAHGRPLNAVPDLKSPPCGGLCLR